MHWRSNSLQFTRVRICGLIPWLVLFALAPLSGSVGQEPGPNEYQVKAAYLFNFAKFVEWPPNTFSSAAAPVQICVLGANPFGHALEDSVAGKIIAGRRLEVSNFSRGVDPRSCQILFISSSEKRRMREILQQFAGAGVLTVADTSGFMEEGGMINFVVDGDQVRFEANLEAAQQAHLKISARLLAVAKIVVGNSNVEEP